MTALYKFEGTNHYFTDAECPNSAALLQKLKDFSKACAAMELQARKITNTAEARGMEIPDAVDYIITDLGFKYRHLDLYIHQMTE